MDLFFIFKKLKMIKDKLPIIKKYPTIPNSEKISIILFIQK